MQNGEQFAPLDPNELQRAVS